ncbi:MULTISPECIES: endonuclease/exonuclease/phosphatase family protein [unclassified Flavobacterium]|uniref:endonuclease/exonuclease/phosphatase family protein n=1 Tax=unclassified Flavobacterium TaxID=196869 RepID=UPI000F0C9BF6|nr:MULTISPECIES: endonuclease/exonuclease/phosphatase family protein [unclassified Flavobacterium]AYN04958.1 endonuclease [Flavobacterium sp. 140616W15]MCD0476693.1 endonuclease/exonuclease/phosphatase family protein [Flavobacterium sp. EDS]
MKIQFTVLFFLLTTLLYSQTKILSWNIENFGKSKTEQDIDFIANTIKNHDIIAIQEVVAGYGGAQAVARLVDQLNRKGAKWDYSISNPTSSSAYKTERYAFIWKTNKAKLIGKPWLEKQYEKQIDREPYFATFEKNGKNFTIVSFHAITKSKQPETEIKYFKFLPQQYSNQNLIFVGDFNCPQSHTVFNPLKKMGYLPTLENQKTSLKQKCINNQCLASEYDNIFYHSSKIKIIDKGIIHFYKDFNSLKEARRISDHIPIWMEFSLN